MPVANCCKGGEFCLLTFHCELYINSLTPKNDVHPKYPSIITSESHIKVTGIKEMINF